jgi:hypothetical protein
MNRPPDGLYYEMTVRVGRGLSFTRLTWWRWIMPRRATVIHRDDANHQDVVAPDETPALP